MTNDTGYANSRERLAHLEQVRIDGKDATSVMKYASKFKELEEEKLLSQAREHCDLYEASLRYSIVCDFYDMLKAAINEADKKNSTYEQLRKGIINGGINNG